MKLIKYSLFLLLINALLVACSNAENGANIATEPTTTPLSALSTVETNSTAEDAVPTIAPTAFVSVDEELPTAVAENLTEATVVPTPTTPGDPVTLTHIDDFGDTRSPLTGELVANPELLKRRPIECKISDSPAEWVRPQSGINSADLVFEHLTEGPIPRFAVIIHSKTPEKLGPVRSARLIDLELPAMYSAALCFSGANIGVTYLIEQADFQRRVLWSYFDGYYRTGENKPYEHTFYANPEAFWDELQKRGQYEVPKFDDRKIMTFSEATPAGGTPISTIAIDYQGWSTAGWSYDANTNRYWRVSDDEPHIDANTDEQLNMRNIVIVRAEHEQVATKCIAHPEFPCEPDSTQIALWGFGTAQLYRDGQLYEGRWFRETRRDMLRIVDNEGNDIPFQIGNTWIHVLPYYMSNAVTISP